MPTINRMVLDTTYEHIFTFTFNLYISYNSDRSPMSLSVDNILNINPHFSTQWPSITSHLNDQRSTINWCVINVLNIYHTMVFNLDILANNLISFHKWFTNVAEYSKIKCTFVTMTSLSSCKLRNYINIIKFLLQSALFCFGNC